ncbi:LysR family transcriptional regulator [Roseivivax isoporae]|uniref:LysR family transcripitonal regulator n=1 Tax=Roseivivax isoporae LMG 25204 TaxID=1449351 RepID=X7F8Y0_9RHOB|nr:LysR family transcriptional regulator [Roseivivax isoporae]ETX28531.1 LysR family transcripitonal regulator [Roseivivax isoporae LMG 25204]
MRRLHELPQTRDLAAFVAVVEDGGFAEAARRLNTAPSTLSRTVSRLESVLGVTLLRRTTRSIEMTPEGRELREAARGILERTEALADIGAGSRSPRGPLRVNAPVPFVLHALAPRLAGFRAAWPDVALTLDMTDSLVDLIEAHADVAIRFGPLPDSAMLHRRLGHTPWKLVAAPGYLDRTGWPGSPGELSDFEQVRFAAPEHINVLKFRDLPAPVTPRPAIVAGNGEAARHLVLGGLGLARFSEFMVAGDLAEGRLVELFPGALEAEPLEITALYLTRASGLRRLAVFLDWLEESLRAP